MNLESLEARQVLNVGPIGILQQDADNSAWKLSGNEGASTSLNLHASLVDTEISPEVVDDFTGDGIDDILGRNANGSWYLQVNDGTQFFAVSRGVGPAGNAELIGTADFNGDGALDILTRDAGNNLRVSDNSDTRFINRFWGQLPAEPTHHFVADFDGDGDMDAMFGEIGGRWTLARNNGNSFTILDQANLGDYGWSSIVSGDFNGDGRADLAALAGDRTWWLWHSTDSGLENAKYWGSWRQRDSWQDVGVGDFNNDGRDDIIGRTDDARLWVGTSTDTRFHTWTWAKGWVQRADWRNVMIVDMNADGLPDQVGQAKDSTWWYSLNTGANNFRNYFWQHQEVSGFFKLQATEDIQRDEATDVIAAMPEGGANLNDSLVVISLNAENQLVLTGDGQSIVGLEIKSPSEGLVPVEGGNANPFQFLLLNTPSNVTYASINSGVVLDEPLVLSVGLKSTDVSDLSVSYGVAGTSTAVEALIASPLGSFDADKVYSTAEINEFYYNSLSQ